MAKPWYKETSVWSLCLSFVALVLSQLPPIFRDGFQRSTSRLR